MGSKVLKQKLYEYEAALKHRDSQIKELQNILNSKDVEIRQLLELTKEGGEEREGLRSSMSAQQKELAVEPGVGDKEKSIRAKEEEINSLRFAVNEQQKEIDRLSSGIEQKEKEWEFKISEQKVQMDGMMAEKDARLKRLEELLRNREAELERHTTKDNSFKKQIQAKEKLIKIARAAANEKEKEIDILRKRLENKEQELKFITDELKIEMSSALIEKDDLIGTLEGSLKVKESELERKHSEEKETARQLQVKEEELTAIRSAMNQKAQEALELTKALENKEHELRSSKSEMATTFSAKESRLFAIKNRSFWEALKAFFRVNRMEHH